MHNINEEVREVKGKAIAYISAALGLVAGLAWNEAITELINTLFPLSKDTVVVKFVYALILTAVVVMVIKQLDRFNKKVN